MFLDLQGESIPESQVVGYGGTGVVVLRDGVAIKIPFRKNRTSEARLRGNLKVIRLEQNVYRRLNPSQDNQCPGVVPCLGFTEESIQLAYMKNGELRSYLESHTPSRTLQLSWFRQMAHTLANIHERRVLVTDIATRNFLLDADMSLKLCDFSEASVLPLQTNMETADDEGYTVAVDIGLLGVVMYEIVTGSRCEIDLYKDNDPSDGRAYWPDRRHLPSTENLWLGPVIEDCWTAAFRDARSLSQAFDALDERPSLAKEQSSCLFLRAAWGCVRERHIASMAVCGLAICVWVRLRGVHR